MATLEREEERGGERKRERKEVPPLPLHLLYPEAKETYTELEELEAELAKVPPLPPRSPLEEELELEQEHVQPQELEIEQEHVHPQELEQGQAIEEEEVERVVQLEDLRGIFETQKYSARLQGPSVTAVNYPSLPAKQTEQTEQPTEDQLPKQTEHESSASIVALPASEPQQTEGNKRYLKEMLRGNQMNHLIEKTAVLQFTNLRLGVLVEQLVATSQQYESKGEPEFISLVKAYRDAEAALDGCQDEIDRKFSDCKLKQATVWIRKTGTAEQSQVLRVGVGEIKAHVNFSYSQFSRKKAQQFEKDLLALDELKSSTLTLYQFERTMSNFALAEYILSYLSKSSLFSPKVDPASEPQSLRQEIATHARIFFTVLLSFEQTCVDEIRTVPPALDLQQNQWRRRFLQEIRGWLLHIGAALLQSGQSENRVFLLNHLTQYSGIGSDPWALQLLQFGPVRPVYHNEDDRANSGATSFGRWSREDVEDFVAMFEILLHSPVPRERESNNDDVEARGRMSELDLIALLEQCPTSRAFENLFSLEEKTVEAVHNCFCIANFVGGLIEQTIRRMPFFTQFVKLLGEILCDLTRYAEEFLNNLPVGSPLVGYTQVFFDSICLRVAGFLFFCENTNMGLLLKSLPLGKLSNEAAWRLLLAMYTGHQTHTLSDLLAIVGFQDQNGNFSIKDPLHGPVQDSCLPHSNIVADEGARVFHAHESICSLAGWTAATETDPGLRARFLAELNNNNNNNSSPQSGQSGYTQEKTPKVSGQTNALFRVLALATLASSSHSEIATAVLEELLIATFLTPHPCVLKEDDLIRPIQNIIGDICSSHPQLVSLVFQTALLHEDCFEKHGQALFQSLPVHLWSPCLAKDVPQFRKWLMPLHTGEVHSGLISPFCAIAMDLIDRMNWGLLSGNKVYTEPYPTFLAPQIHRDLAVIIIEACVARSSIVLKARATKRMSTLRRWIPLTQEYQEESALEAFSVWAWKSLLGFTLFHPCTFEPLVQQLDISNPNSASLGGLLGHLWRTSLQEARVAKEKDQDKDQDESSLDAFLSPLLATGMLFLTNYVEVIKDWRPLLVLRHFAADSRSSSTEAVQKAFFRSLFYLIPQFLGSNNEALTLLPSPTVWLQPVFGLVSVSKDRAGTGVMGDLLSRVFSSSSATASQSGGTSSSSAQGATLSSSSSASSSNSKGLVRTGSFSGIPKGAGRRKSVSSTGAGEEAWEHLALLVQSQIVVLGTSPFETCRNKTVACVLFWVQAILQLDDWEVSPKHRSVLDALILSASCVESTQRDLHLVMHIEAQFALQADKLIHQKTKKRHGVAEVSHLSLLPAPHSGLFSKSDAAGVVPDCFWLSFHALLVETGREFPLWKAFGHVLTDSNKSFADVDEARSELGSLFAHSDEEAGKETAWQFLHVDLKRLSQFRIYRWANYALQCPADHPLLVLYWQVFFVLYFSKSGNIAFGFKFLCRSKKQTRRANLREELLARANTLSIHFRDISRKGSSKKNHWDSAADELGKLFHAFVLWLRDSNPTTWLVSIGDLDAEFCVGRLVSVLDSPLLQVLHSLSTSPEDALEKDRLAKKRLLWLDLVDLKPFQQTLEMEPRLFQPVSSFLVRKQSRIRGLSFFGLKDSAPLSNGTEPLRAPVYIYREPVLHMTPDQVLQVDPKTILKSLLDHSLRHSEDRSKFRERLKHLADTLPRLYRKEQRMKTIEKAPPTGKEKEKYRFDICFEESVIDEPVQRDLNVTWRDCERFDFGWNSNGLSPFTSKTGHGQAGASLWKSNRSGEYQTAQNQVELCQSVSTMLFVVDQLVAMSADQQMMSSEDQVRLRQCGTAWFHTLLEVENKSTRNFLPVQRALWTSIVKTGRKFARGHPTEAKRILLSMLSDLNRVHLLTPLFEPASFVQIQLELYSMLWDHIPRIPARDCVPILAKFDFDAWLDVPPSIELRSQLLSMVGGVLRQKSWKGDGGDKGEKDQIVFDFHLGLFTQICNRFFLDHFVQCVEILVGGSFTFSPDRAFLATDSPAPGALSPYFRKDVAGRVASEICTVPTQGKVWQRLLQVPNGRWEEVPFDLLERICGFLSVHFAQVRAEGCSGAGTVSIGPGNLVGQWKRLGLVECFVDLADKLCGLLLKKIDEFANDESIIAQEMTFRAWNALLALYDPWITSAYDSSDDQSMNGVGFNRDDNMSLGCWETGDEELGKKVVAGFVRCCKGLNQKCFLHEPYWILDRVVWVFFEKISPGAPEHVRNEFVTQFLEELPWENWALCWELLCRANIATTMSTSRDAEFHFVRNIVVRLNWRETEGHFSRSLEERNEAVTAQTFYGDLLNLLVRLVCKQELPFPAPMGKFYLQMVHGLPWHYVVPSQFESILIEAMGWVQNVSLGQHQELGEARKKAKPSKQPLDSEEKRIVSLLRMLGNATALDLVCQSLGEEHEVEVHKSLIEAGVREELFLRGLRKLLEDLLHSPRSHSAGALTSSSTSEAVVEESKRMPCSPGAFVMIYYESLFRVGKLLGALGRVAQECQKGSGVSLLVGSPETSIVAMVVMVMQEVLQFLNIDGFAFADVRSFVSHNGYEGQQDSGIADAVFGRIENAIRTLSSALPSSIRVDAGLVSNQGPSSSSNTSTSSSQANSAAGISWLGDPESPGTQEANWSRLWSSWNHLWKLVLSMMLAASQKAPPFDRFEESVSTGETVINSRDQSMRRRLSRKLSSSSLRQRSQSFQQQQEHQDTSGKEELEKEPHEQAKHLLVSGVGCGTVTFCFLAKFCDFTPLFGFAATRSIQNQSRVVEVLEACAESWLVRQGDMGALLAGWWASSPVESHVIFRRAAIQRGGWLVLYVHFVYLVSTGVLSEDDCFVRLGQAIVECIQVQLNGGGSFLRPQPFKLIPLLQMFFELLVTTSHPEAFRAQQAYAILDSLQELVSDRSSVFATLAAAVLNRLPFMSSTSASPEEQQQQQQGASFSSSISSSSSRSRHNSHDVEVSQQPVQLFRIFVKCLLPFMYLNSKRSVGFLRVDSSTGLNEKSKKAQAALSSVLNAYPSNRAVMWACAFAKDSQNNLRSSHEFLNTLVTRLNSTGELVWLQRPRREWRVTGAVHL